MVVIPIQSLNYEIPKQNVNRLEKNYYHSEMNIYEYRTLGLPFLGRSLESLYLKEE